MTCITLSFFYVPQLGQCNLQKRRKKAQESIRDLVLGVHLEQEQPFTQVYIKGWKPYR